MQGLKGGRRGIESPNAVRGQLSSEVGLSAFCCYILCAKHRLQG